MSTPLSNTEVIFVLQRTTPSLYLNCSYQPLGSHSEEDGATIRHTMLETRRRILAPVQQIFARAQDIYAVRTRGDLAGFSALPQALNAYALSLQAIQNSDTVMQRNFLTLYQTFIGASHLEVTFLSHLFPVMALPASAPPRTIIDLTDDSNPVIPLELSEEEIVASIPVSIVISHYDTFLIEQTCIQRYYRNCEDRLKGKVRSIVCQEMQNVEGEIETISSFFTGTITIQGRAGQLKDLPGLLGAFREYRRSGNATHQIGSLHVTFSGQIKETELFQASLQEDPHALALLN